MLSPNEERLELARQDANEALIPAPRDLAYPKYEPAPRTKTIRDIFLTSPCIFGFYLRYHAQKEKPQL